MEIVLLTYESIDKCLHFFPCFCYRRYFGKITSGGKADAQRALNTTKIGFSIDILSIYSADEKLTKPSGNRF